MKKRGSDVGGGGEVDGVTDTAEIEYDSDENLEEMRCKLRLIGLRKCYIINCLQ